MWADRPSTMASCARGMRRLNSATSGSVSMRPYARRQADDDAAGGFVAVRPEVLARPRHQLQDAHRMFEQALARLGEHHAAPRALQQGDVQIGLEQSHLAAERGLCHTQLDGGLAEAAHFGPRGTKLRNWVRFMPCRSAIAWGSPHCSWWRLGTG